MKFKTNYLAAGFVFLSALLCSSLITAQQKESFRLTEKEIAKQIQLAKKEPCADVENKLYLINNRFIYWLRKGNCSDNNFAYYLIGKGLKELCSNIETIDGPKTKYTPGMKELFNKIIAHSEETNLGLNSTYTVKLIYSAK